MNEATAGARVAELLEALEGVPASERGAYLARVCPDAAVRREVLSLLAIESASTGYLERIVSAVGELAPRRPAPPDLTGKRIGAYRLLHPLGRGGMGVVYEAERADGAFEQRVALKLLATALTGTEAHERFLAERRILAGLEHPAIAHIVDGGVSEDGTPWFALERVEGEPIDVYCDRRRLGIDERLRLFLQVCDAVEHAHRRFVVHRDLKPANVLVTGEGQVKLLDFGIARLLDRDEHGGKPATGTALRMMTPEYASPEQVRGEQVTVASDVYQLGLVLHELLSGRRPYVLRRRSASEIERVICEQAPTRLSTAPFREDAREASGETFPAGTEAIEALCRARNSTPARLRRRLRGDLETIVARALAKEPERRYGSADRLAQDIRRHLDGLPVAAGPDTWTYRCRKFFERHAVGAIAAILVFLLVAGLTGFYTWRVQGARDRAESERDRAQAEAAKTRQVSEFLADLFRSADPREARGTDVAARRALLDEGVERVDRELAGQPEVRADMLHVLGRTYLELGVYDAAEDLLTRSLGLHRRRFGPAHPEVGETLRDLGLLRYRQGAYAEARARLEQARRIFAAAPEGGSSGLADVLSILGQVHRTLGAHEQSRATFELALAAQRRAPGARSEALAAILHNTGTVLFEVGDLERAERHYKEALVVYERELGKDHPQVGYLLLDLANARLELGKLTDLEATYRRSLAIARQAYGPSHAEVGLVLISFGHFLTATGRPREAIEVLEQALETLRATAGPDHPWTAYPLSNLGDAHRADGSLREARARYREAVAHRSRALGGHRRAFDPILAHGLVWLGRVEEALGNGAAASRLQDRALAMWRQAPETLTVQVAPALRELGAWLVETRRCAEAVSVLRRGLAVERARRPVLTAQVAALEGRLAACAAGPAVPGRTGQ